VGEDGAVLGRASRSFWVVKIVVVFCDTDDASVPSRANSAVKNLSMDTHRAMPPRAASEKTQTFCKDLRIYSTASVPSCSFPTVFRMVADDGQVLSVSRHPTEVRRSGGSTFDRHVDQTPDTTTVNS